MASAELPFAVAVAELLDLVFDSRRNHRYRLIDPIPQTLPTDNRCNPAVRRSTPVDPCHEAPPAAVGKRRRCSVDLVLKLRKRRSTRLIFKRVVFRGRESIDLKGVQRNVRHGGPSYRVRFGQRPYSLLKLKMEQALETSTNGLTWRALGILSAAPSPSTGSSRWTRWRDDFGDVLREPSIGLYNAGFTHVDR